MQDFKQRGRPKLKKQEAETMAPAMLKNVSSNPHAVYSILVKPGATYTPTDANKADVLASKRIANAVDCGFLEWV